MIETAKTKRESINRLFNLDYSQIIQAFLNYSEIMGHVTGNSGHVPIFFQNR